jgi:hypothetical protein
LTQTLANYLAEYRREHGGALPPIAGGSPAAIAEAPEGYAAAPGVAPSDLIPFDQASHPLTEVGPEWGAVEIKTESQELEAKSLKANGFTRFVWFLVETEVEGNETAGTAAIDFPFCAVQRIEMLDSNSKPIHSLTGFNWMLATKLGGYADAGDPTTWPSFSAVKKKPNFCVVLPFQFNGEGVGALTNMTEATTFQLAPTIAATGKVYKVAMTTNPKLKIRTMIELWPYPERETLPEPGYPKGRMQEQRPPMEGTRQMWTEVANVKVNTGEQSVRFTRVGQMVRTHILVTRESAAEATRLDTVMPNPATIMWGRVKFRTYFRQFWKLEARRWFGGSNQASGSEWETGVWPLVYSYGLDHYAGGNDFNSFMPTVNATSLYLEGSFNEGLVTFITNDVAFVPASAEARRETPGVTYPATGRMVT